MLKLNTTWDVVILKEKESHKTKKKLSNVIVGISFLEIWNIRFIFTINICSFCLGLNPALTQFLNYYIGDDVNRKYELTTTNQAALMGWDLFHISMEEGSRFCASTLGWSLVVR